MRDDKICRLTLHILSPPNVSTTAAHFVARRQIVHGGDEMCRQRRYNLSPATKCAVATSLQKKKKKMANGDSAKEFLANGLSLSLCCLQTHGLTWDIWHCELLSYSFLLMATVISTVDNALMLTLKHHSENNLSQKIGSLQASVFWQTYSDFE